MLKIFICSRFAGNSAEDMNRNIAIAKELCKTAIKLGYTPFAPHLFYPQFLDESSPEDRELGIKCGLVWMRECDQVWAYMPEGVSTGMRREIEFARVIKKQIIEITEPVL